jgi:hypothetical protein
MKRAIGIVMGLAMAVAAFAVVGVGSASALPELLHCMTSPTKVEAGERWFTNQTTCEKLEGKGEFVAGSKEWLYGPFVAGEKLSFTSTSGAGTLETVKKETVKCTSDTNAGEFTSGTTAAKVVVTFKGCTGPLGSECQNTATKGEIATKSLKGVIGYIKKAAPIEVGVLLEPETAGALDAEFECVGLFGIKSTLKVRGSLICKIEPINKMTSAAEKGKIVCSQTAGKQAVKKFEGEATEHTLETEAKGAVEFPFEESGETTTDELDSMSIEVMA